MNTIGVFTNSPNPAQPSEVEDGSKFLKQIAEDHGGTFVGAMKKK